MNKLNLDLTKNKKIIMSNDAITGKQTMTLKEAKLLRLLIMQINMKDKKLMEYRADIKEVAACLGVDESNIYRDIHKICDQLTGRRLKIKTDNSKNPWASYPWMSMAEYDGDGTLTLGLNEKIRPFVIELSELFTQYEMIDILSINSFYALRIYEVLKKEFTKCNKTKHVFEFTIQELREITDTEDKFKQVGIFRLKVLDIAEREINEKTDLIITVDSIKKSRRFIGFKFTIQEKMKQLEPLNPDKKAPIKIEDPIPGQINLGEIYEIKSLLESLKIPCSQRQAEKIFTAYAYDLDRFKRNLDYVIQKCPDNPIAYLFSIKDEDIAPKADLPKPEKTEKTKPRKRNITEPMSAERVQAYLDLEVDHSEDLWPDLELSEEDL